jgi:serine/threonine protein phosphatase 1
MSTWAIGDIHGHREALEDLVARVEPQLRPTDELVFLGDYIDDGPDTAGCIGLIVELTQRAPCPVVGLMGNREEWMLRSRTDPRAHSWLLGVNGLRTIASYSADVARTIEEEIEATPRPAAVPWQRRRPVRAWRGCALGPTRRIPGRRLHLGTSRQFASLSES